MFSPICCKSLSCKLSLFYIVSIVSSFSNSEEEARMKIYSVSTRCYFAFGALVSEELSYKIKGIIIIIFLKFVMSAVFIEMSLTFL